MESLILVRQESRNPFLLPFLSFTQIQIGLQLRDREIEKERKRETEREREREREREKYREVLNAFLSPGKGPIQRIALIETPPYTLHTTHHNALSIHNELSFHITLFPQRSLTYLLFPSLLPC